MARSVVTELAKMNRCFPLGRLEQSEALFEVTVHEQLDDLVRANWLEPFGEVP